MSKNQEPLSVSKVLETLAQPSSVALSIEEAETSVVGRHAKSLVEQDGENKTKENS
jgi:hypothetical protein